MYLSRPAPRGLFHSQRAPSIPNAKLLNVVTEERYRVFLKKETATNKNVAFKTRERNVGTKVQTFFQFTRGFHFAALRISVSQIKFGWNIDEDFKGTVRRV